MNGAEGCRIWYCARCRGAYKAMPPVIAPTCNCPTPVETLQSTTVTLLPLRVQALRLQALTDDEARHRALARPGQRVRITFEADVDTAWLTPDADGRRHTVFAVTADDGSRHHIDTRLPGVHMAAADRRPTATNEKR